MHIAWLSYTWYTCHEYVLNTDLGVVVERGRVLVLHVLALRVEQGQRVPLGVRRLPARGEEPLLVEVVRGVLDDGLVGAVVLAEHDLAWEVGRVEAVEDVEDLEGF